METVLTHSEIRDRLLKAYDNDKVPFFTLKGLLEGENPKMILPLIAEISKALDLESSVEPLSNIMKADGHETGVAYSFQDQQNKLRILICVKDGKEPTQAMIIIFYYKQRRIINNEK